MIGLSRGGTVSQEALSGGSSKFPWLSTRPGQTMGFPEAGKLEEEAVLAFTPRSSRSWE